MDKNSQDKKNTVIWSISLLLIGIVTIILIGSKIMNIQLPDILVRAFGILEIIAIIALVYTSIKKCRL